jgi:hypothetical protein
MNESTLPPYRSISERDLPLSPPFKVHRLLNMYFPIPADLGRLRKLCDEYLNFHSGPSPTDIPEEVGRFEPFLPYVFLVFLIYPKVEPSARQTGWFSQRELAFGFPVEWQRKKNGLWHSEGSVFLYPLIYLDSTLGLTTGREVHGWPKDIATFESSIHGEGDLMSGRPCSCRMSTAVVDRSRGSSLLVPRTLLEIVPSSRPKTSGLLRDWQTLAGSTMTTWKGLLEGVSGQAGINVMNLERWRASIAALQKRRVVTVKEFRDRQNPNTASYQALILSALDVRSYGACGLLGAFRTCTGDLSGGHEVRIHQHASHPIVDLLGLRHNEQESPSNIFSTKPVLPFWFEMDLVYRTESVLCERTAQRGWQVRGSAKVEQTRSAPHPYNEARKPFTECVPGPFEVKDALLRILSFTADSTAIDRICSAYCLRNDGIVRRPSNGGDMAYMILATGTQRSLSPPETAWPFSLLGLYVPADHAAGRVYLAPLEFVDSPASAIGGREVDGRNIWLAEFGGTWLDESTTENAPLLRVSSPVFDGVGAEAKLTTVVEVTSAARSNVRSTSMRATSSATSSVRALHLRQYRDAVDATKAVCQEVLHSAVHITNMRAAEGIGRIAMQIRRNAMFSIAADLLGTELVEPLSTACLRADLRVGANDLRPH